jgi:hypothetical protein
MASPPSIAVGQRFRDIQFQSFHRTGLEWVVRDLITGTDGVAYARIVCASDPTRVKTLSFTALADRHRFQRLDR